MRCLFSRFRFFYYYYYYWGHPSLLNANSHILCFESLYFCKSLYNCEFCYQFNNKFSVIKWKCCKPIFRFILSLNKGIFRLLLPTQTAYLCALLKFSHIQKLNWWLKNLVIAVNFFPFLTVLLLDTKELI